METPGYLNPRWRILPKATAKTERPSEDAVTYFDRRQQKQQENAEGWAVVVDTTKEQILQPINVVNQATWLTNRVSRAALVVAHRPPEARDDSVKRAIAGPNQHTMPEYRQKEKALVMWNLATQVWGLYQGEQLGIIQSNDQLREPLLVRHLGALGVMTISELDRHQSSMSDLVGILHQVFSAALANGASVQDLFKLLWHEVDKAGAAGADVNLFPVEYHGPTERSRTILKDGSVLQGQMPQLAEGDVVEFRKQSLRDLDERLETERRVDVPPRETIQQAQAFTGPMTSHDLTGRFGRTVARKAWQHRSADSGPRLGRIEHILDNGKVFLNKRRGAGGTLLIDCSGSMHIAIEYVQAIMDQRPLMSVALYASNQQDLQSGVLVHIARNHRCVPDLEHAWKILGQGNVVDLPALQWLIKQPRPRWWVCDGVVTGRGDSTSHALTQTCMHLAQTGQVVRYNSMDQFLITQNILPPAFLAAFEGDPITW